jgi:hypothetical protein
MQHSGCAPLSSTQTLTPLDDPCTTQDPGKDCSNLSYSPESDLSEASPELWVSVPEYPHPSMADNL